MPEEPHRRLCGKPFAAAKNLQRHFVPLELNRLGERLVAIGHLDQSHVAQADVVSPDFQNVSHDRRSVGVAQQISESRRHPIISFGHYLLPLCSLSPMSSRLRKKPNSQWIS